jgi:PAS domain S-box-containing protein
MELQPERALSQSFLELAPDAIVVADATGHLLLVNHQTEVLFDYARAELLGQPVEVLLPARLRALHEQHRAHYVAAPHTRPMGTGLELYGQRRDGSEFPVEVSLSPLQADDGLLIIGIIRDITERKRLEAAERAAHVVAERRRRLLQVVLDELPGGAYLVQGRDAELVMANRAAMDVWGATWPEGLPMADFLRISGVQYFAENGHLLAVEDLVTVRVVRSDRQAEQQREVIARPDGTRLPILLSAVAIDPGLLEAYELKDAGATSAEQTRAAEPMRGALVLLQDISALQAAEQLKDEFISIAAHELRTPLAAIQGFASMLVVQTGLGRGPELADWQSEAISEIEAATRRVSELINDLLDATRIQAGRLELHTTPLDLVTVLRRCLARMQSTTTRHTLTLEAPDAPVLLEADGLRLEQVLGNLLGNAIKYSPDGGPITVTVQVNREAELAQVSIRDAGIGIPADQQALLFQRFVRASNVHDHHIAGSGLGLYVCRELVERHGGHIWFESAEGQGTTFFFTLPLSTPDSEGDSNNRAAWHQG